MAGGRAKKLRFAVDVQEMNNMLFLYIFCFMKIDPVQKGNSAAVALEQGLFLLYKQG
jgi:hypothetical protein